MATSVHPEALAKAFTPKVQMHPIAESKPNPRNARTHGKKQVRQLAAAIKTIGFIVPIIIDEAGHVLAGHGRLAAAALNGLTEVPAIQVDHLTPELKRIFALADNRMAELARWNDDLLASELLELSAVELDFDFSFELTGFGTADVDRLTASLMCVN